MIGGQSIPAPGPAAPGGLLVDLRRRTIRRGLKRYADWIGATIGWYAVFYFGAFLVLFIVSGLVEVEPRYHPLPIASSAFPLAIIAGAYYLLRALLPRRTVPLWIAPVDLHRLAMSPLPPARVLAGPFLRSRLLVGGVLASLGGVWTLLAVRWFGASVPLAVVAMAAVGVLEVHLRWLVYAGSAGRGWAPAGRGWTLLAAAAAFLGLLAPAWGLAAPFYTLIPPGLFLLLLLTALTGWRVQAGLRDRYPPGFAHQSFLAAELRALTFSGLLNGNVFDLDRMTQLVGQLRGRRTSIRPRVHLHRPPDSWGPAGLLGWRSAQMLLRRTWPGLIGTFLSVPAAITLGIRPSGDVLGLIHGSVIIGLVCAVLLGPPPRPAHLPIPTRSRTLGRILPGSLLVVAFTLFFFLPATLLAGRFFGGSTFSFQEGSRLIETFQSTGGPVSLPTPGGLLQAATTLILGMTLLEKLSTQAGQSYRRFQLFVPAAFTALLPALTIGVRYTPGVAGYVNIVLVILILRLFR